MKSHTKKQHQKATNAIKHRFNIAILMFILVPALILTSFYIYKSTNTRVNTISANIKEANTDLIRLQRLEENFLSWKNPQYLNDFQITYSNILGHLDYLSKETAYQEEFLQLEDIMRNYYNLFTQIITAYTTIGLDTQSGLQGNLNEAAKKITEEAQKTNNPSLVHDILQLNLLKSEFFLYKDPQIASTFTKNCDQLLTSLPDLKIPEEARTLIKQQTEEYKTKFSALVEIMRKTGFSHHDGMQNEINALTAQLEPQFIQLEELIVTAQKKKVTLISLLVFSAIGFLIIFFIIIYRFVNGDIIRPINQLGRHIGLLTTGIKETQGDLTTRIAIEKENEIGELSRNYNYLLDIFHDIFRTIKFSTAANARISEKIATGSQELAAGSNEQTIAVTQTASTLEQLYSITHTSTQSITTITSDLDSFNKRVEDKKDHIAEVTQTMQDIDESGNQIGDIVRVINDISFRTNLLALNAAVEAARAGEAGRGFAVVATEVRNLAQKTAESSKNIQNIINRNLHSTKKGLELVHQTAEFFSAIAADIQSILTQIKENAAGLKEQSQGMEHITMAVSNLEAIISRNNALSSQFNTMSNDIISHTMELEKIVTPFKVNDTNTLTSKNKTHTTPPPTQQKKELTPRAKETKKDHKIVIPKHTHKPHDDHFFNENHSAEEFEEF